MFDWLFEGRISVYVVLAALAVFLFLVWWQLRKRWLLGAIVLAAALPVFYAFLDISIETDREQIFRKLNEMVAAVNTHNLDAAFVHISEQFRSPGGKSKQELRSTAQAYLQQRIIQRVQVWDIVIEGHPSREQGEVHVFFSAKTSNGQEILTDCDSIFQFDAQQGWQLRTFRLLKPQTIEEWGWPI